MLFYTLIEWLTNWLARIGAGEDKDNQHDSE